MTITELRDKRNKAWEAAKAFVETKRNADGLMTAEDAATYAQMEQKVQDYSTEIDRMERQEAMDRQLTLANCNDRRELPFHKMLLNGELPLTMGGGIGQSRLCMLMMGCAHIGEVQSSVWDHETVEACAKAGIRLL